MRFKLLPSLEKMLSFLQTDLIVITGVLIPYFLIGSFKLDIIPGEWFGDISIVNNYVQLVLSKSFPFLFIAGGGPFYHYLIAPLIFIFGDYYITYKYISLLIGGIGIVCIYFLAKEISNKSTAIITAILTSFSIWYFIWSRLGNYNIIVPVLSSIVLLGFFRFLLRKGVFWMIISMIFASFGLFTYPGSFFLPVLLLLFVFTGVFQKQLPTKVALFTLLGFIPAIAAFIIIIMHNPDSFSSTGYIGAKIFNNFHHSLADNLKQFIINLYRTYTMFHIEGDVVFRWNISKSPLIDPLSGLFLFIGILIAIVKKMKLSFYLFLTLLLLPIPSALPGHPAIEVPSSPRNMAIIPVIFFFTAFGIQKSFNFLFHNKKLRVLSTCLVITIIILWNMFRYFYVYPVGLPNQNTPFGKIIASYIDTIPDNVPVYLASCCWGDWGQPERDGIYYALLHRGQRYGTLIMHDYITSTQQVLPDKPFLIILSPNQTLLLGDFQRAFPFSLTQKHIVNNQNVFFSFYKP